MTFSWGMTRGKAYKWVPPRGRGHSHAGLDLHYPMPCSKPLILGMPNPGGSSNIKTSLRLSSRLKFYHPKLTLSSTARQADRCPHSEVVIKRKYFACIFVEFLCCFVWLLVIIWLPLVCLVIYICCWWLIDITTLERLFSFLCSFVCFGQESLV
jgi:hypothetical protein